MFTGLIEEIGKIKDIQIGDVSKVSVYCPFIMEKSSLGDSVSVNGACLTVSKISSDFLVFDAVRETLSMTNLGDLKSGDKVNLETALTLSKPMGGHIVSGHIDGIGTIVREETIGISREITFKADKDVLKYVVNKGSIAIDGISLTVASVSSGDFKIAVIPHTLRFTTLMDKRIGDKVNLETDILGRYVEKFLSINKNSSSDETLMSLLGEKGFL